MICDRFGSSVLSGISGFIALFPCRVSANGVGDGVSVFHSHLGELQLLLTVLVYAVADDEDDDRRRPADEDGYGERTTHPRLRSRILYKETRQ